ncbi:hypothetical protein [Seonamhaeicola aphaedonensis]|uniref:Prepilin-type N-terminal cleavage/methylation domain-containing protein n=1 Tax=Seonamhaeicola aphaedonensis TaxID=1461338 RepID=A0A3D9H833_9FLAO|nr:hypothetical protein [Seonamhaeicola aphaedonensis]RED45652.1 hypothetical protein DFQ02_10830 [Seonamhaeicola aphaedonensis]
MKNKRLNAFTILEALIGLMLMGIIISTTYTLFNVMNKQLSLLSHENTQVLEYNLFNSTILGDIHKANDFYVLEDKLVLNNYDESTIRYAINKQHITRQSTIKIDTFNIPVTHYRFPYQKNNNDFLRITLNILGDKLETNYFLKKDNAQIINATYFNEN